MKKLTIATAIIATCASASAFSKDSARSDDFELRAQAPRTCVLADDDQMSNSLILVRADVDTAYAADGVSQEIKFGDSYCNYKHAIRLVTENGGMIPNNFEGRVVEGSDEFASVVEYTAELRNWGADIDLDTSTMVDGEQKRTLQNVDGAFRNDAVSGDPLTITITSKATTAPMLAGFYNDVLRVRLTPQL